MDKIISVKNALLLDKGTVSLHGWVYRKRGSDNVMFIIVRDTTGIIQTVVSKKDVPKKVWDDANRLYIESSLNIKGKLILDKRAPGGRELLVTSMQPVTIGEPFRIARDFSTEFLLDNRHLWLRSQKMSNILKARHYVIKTLRNFFDELGFYEVVPPIIVKNKCEGGSKLFDVKYFKDNVFLTESGQLYAESLIYSLGKVYNWAPSFRAEKSRTVRHLTEDWHLEPEMAWYGYEENIKLQEQMIETVAKELVKNHSDILENLKRDPCSLKQVKAPFKRITYDKMINKLQGMDVKIEYGDDPGADEEKMLTANLKKPLIIERFPKNLKAFYMRTDPKHPDYVLAADILAPEGHGEIIGGSERIYDLQELLDAMKAWKLDPKDPAYSWYVDLRRYGSIPHSGFGLGIERLLKWLLNLDHIRDTIPYPRVINRVYP